MTVVVPTCYAADLNLSLHFTFNGYLRIRVAFRNVLCELLSLYFELSPSILMGS